MTHMYENAIMKQIILYTSLIFGDYFICTSVLPVCTYVYHMHVWVPQRPEKGIGPTGAVVTGCC